MPEFDIFTVHLFDAQNSDNYYAGSPVIGASGELFNVDFSGGFNINDFINN